MDEFINAIRGMDIPVDCDLFWKRMGKEDIFKVCEMLQTLASIVSEINAKAPDVGETIVTCARMSFAYVFLQKNAGNESVKNSLLDVYVILLTNCGQMPEIIQFAAELYMQLNDDNNGRRRIIEAIVNADIGADVISFILFDMWSGIIDSTNSYFFLCMIYQFRDSRRVLQEFRQDFWEALEIFENILGCSVLEDSILCDLIGIYTKMYPLILVDENLK